MNLNESLQGYVQEYFDWLRPYFGLGPTWLITICNEKVLDEEGNELRGATQCDPEYSEGTIKIDLEKMKTGDQLEEIIIHETVHLPLNWLHNQADNLAGLAAHLGKPAQTEPYAEYLREQVRRAAEKSATDLGHAFLRCFRRIRELEQEVVLLKGVNDA